MKLEEGIKRIYGTVLVEVQGFFIERYINLCKINNIDIWDVVTINNGIIRFKIAIKDFKKLKKINKKTKCKAKIISKNGAYFKLFRYRKRKFIVVLFLLFITFSILSTKFIWSINVIGNNAISKDDVLTILSDNGIHIGKCSIGLNTRDIVKDLRANLSDAAWIGVDIKGTKLNVEIVEKTRIDMIAKYQNGDILTKKSGIITKIVAENGTPISNVGDYIEENRIVIEGKMYTRTNEIVDVEAKGKVYIENEYNYSNEYQFTNYLKNYTGVKKYSLGIEINNKENYINYLDKSLKYDIIKSVKSFNIFGSNISFGIYKFLIYDLIEQKLTKDEIIQKAKDDAKEYFENDVLPNCNDYEIKDIQTNIISEDNEKIVINVKYKIVEEVGYFKGR